MSISIPASDVKGTELNGRINNLTTLIANNSANGHLNKKLTVDKANAQMDLVLYLLGSGRILASNVLANETYAKPTQEGGDQH